MKLETRTRTIEETGVWLTVPDWNGKDPWFEHGHRPAPIDLHARYRGERVFVTMDTLEELCAQRNWDSQFGQVLLINDTAEGLALEAAGWAVQETRGGYHGTDELRAWFKKAMAEHYAETELIK